MNHSILFDARLVLDKPTGIGSYIASLLPELLRLAPDLHIHLLRRPDPWPGYKLQDWWASNLTHHVSTLPRMTLKQHLHLPRLARQLGVGLLHYPHFDAPVLWGSVPVVSTLYDAKYLVQPKFFTSLGRLKKVYMRFCFAQTLRRAAAIITISEATALDLQRIFKVDANRLYVIHLAASPEFQPAADDKQAKIHEKYELTRPFILSVGERRPHKNHVGLIQAYARSQSRHTHDLVIVGQVYQDYTQPEEMAHKLGLANQVHFLANVDTDDLVTFYTAADLFVLISLYEGFGLPILEAMACGTPVIASSTTATGEVTGDGGIQVNPQNTTQVANAIDRVISDANFQRQQILRGYEWCQNFTWQKTAEQTITVYRRVFKETK